jgi:H+/gluconate symporter-like permease
MNILFLVLAIALFIALVLKNVPIVISTIISSAFLLLTQGMSLYDGITQTYMTGFGNYVTNFFLLFMLGALFGKLVEISGAANSIANGIFKTFGDKFAILGLIITGMILTLGGVNLFVAMFTMYPLAMAMFRKADIPRKFFPPAYFVGCVGVTMTAPFTPSIQNATPIQYFATSVSAAAVPGLISSLLKLVLCTLYVMWVVKRAQNRSEHFEVLDDQATEVITNDKGPSFVISVIPMLAILIVLNIFKQPIVISLFAGIIMAFICYFRYMPRTLKAVSAEIQESVSAGLKTISITAAAAGYGAVVAATPAFQEVTDFVLNLDGNPLLIAGIATMLMAGVMNSSSGSMAITCPILGEKFLAMGVNAEALHRVMVVASSTLDSTPQSGFVCNILDYSHTTHRQGYWHVCVVSVIAPIIETLILIPLCAMFGLA